MEKKPLISQDVAERHLMDALHLRVGRGKRTSFAALAEATGIPERTLRSYVDGTGASLHAFLTLASVLGPAFASDVLAPANLAVQDVVADEPEHMRCLAVLGGAVAMLSEAMADGRIDHVEEARLRVYAQDMLPLIESLARGSRGAELRGIST